MRLRNLAYSLALVGCCAFASVDQEIKGLMLQGQYVAAYDLGKQHPDLLGQPAFDFFYGIAALDGGAPGEGILALERFLLVFPDNRSARFHLARGYYILGEDQRAHREFVDLLPGATTEERGGIERFLRAIRARESRYAPVAGFFVETGLGYDSNINAGARTGPVAGLPGFTVTSQSISARESDAFGFLDTGVQGSVPVAPGVMMYGSLRGHGRWHLGAKNDVFDQFTLGAQGGVSVIQGRNLFRTGIEHSLVVLDDAVYLNNSSMLGEWAYQRDQFNRFGINLQYSWLRYEDVSIYLDKNKTTPAISTASRRDSNMTIAAFSWTHAFTHAWNPVVKFAFTLGEERNQAGRADFSRNIHGLGAIGSMQPMEKVDLSAGINYYNSSYRAHFSGNASLPKRQDDYVVVDLGASYAFAQNWTVKAEASYSRQDSNIGLHDYDRSVFSIKLRYDYK